MDKPATDYNAWLKKYEPTKLHGFKALYYHYLYRFGKIRKKETPQRVSFYMRDELVKFERYQKHFHFLIDNDIETTKQLKTFKENAELRKLRKNIRICNNIFQDIETIREHQRYVTLLEQENKKIRISGKEK